MSLLLILPNSIHNSIAFEYLGIIWHLLVILAFGCVLLVVHAQCVSNRGARLSGSFAVSRHSLLFNLPVSYFLQFYSDRNI